MVTLTELIEKLRQIFESDEIDVHEVQTLLESYKSCEADWEQYAIFDTHKYTRNLVDTGNGKYNLIALCWPPGVGSSIHDHTDSHCFVKLLDGKLKETQYNWPEKKNEHLEEKQCSVYDRNEVSYMNDKLGLHRMENPSHSDNAVSLHLYSPPYSECQAFDERTGRRTKVSVTFYSKFGHKE